FFAPTALPHKISALHLQSQRLLPGSPLSHWTLDSRLPHTAAGGTFLT
ncbi:unnamed protein product, partial [Staurois parvus]